MRLRLHLLWTWGVDRQVLRTRSWMLLVSSEGHALRVGIRSEEVDVWCVRGGCMLRMRNLALRVMVCSIIRRLGGANGGDAWRELKSGGSGSGCSARRAGTWPPAVRATLLSSHHFAVSSSRCACRALTVASSRAAATDALDAKASQLPCPPCHR
eukprot:3479999-Pleurochrysis_carterae.AAC.3